MLILNTPNMGMACCDVFTLSCWVSWSPISNELWWKDYCCGGWLFFAGSSWIDFSGQPFVNISQMCSISSNETYSSISAMMVSILCHLAVYSPLRYLMTRPTSRSECTAQAATRCTHSFLMYACSAWLKHDQRSKGKIDTLQHWDNHGDNLILWIHAGWHTLYICGIIFVLVQPTLLG